MSIRRTLGRLRKGLLGLALYVLPRRQRYFASRLGIGEYTRYVVVQRILRINSHVPWPCHWSSVVKGVANIRLKTFPPFPGYGIAQYIQGINGIEIGRNVRFGPGVKIISANHDLHDYELHAAGAPVTIGDNCWLGADAILLPGVTLGSHVVVAAGSVVTRSFPESDIVLAGTPATIVKKLEPYRGGWDHVFETGM